MRKITILLAFLFMLGTGLVQAQTRTISGNVTNSEDGIGLPGVTVMVKGTQTGSVTDLDGNYSLAVPEGDVTLVFQFVGMRTIEVIVGDKSVVNVTMEADAHLMDEVVVTALGVSRERKSLGYAVQQLGGDEVNTVKRDNFVNNLQGKAAGVQIKSSGNMGGSTNVIIRGSSSLTQNNQALFVVDGVPINNANTNNSGQLSGRNGYDYGDAASDINPADIESIDILKGAAATALYGSRAANGVIMITTKKGAKTAGPASYGVKVSSNITTGFIDKSTFPKYQTEYGAGYGPFYGDAPYTGFEHVFDVNGDGEVDYTVPTYEDASFGQKFDPSFSLYQWDAYDPASPNYMKKTPWTVGANGPEYFFQTPVSTTNTVEVGGGTDKATFFLTYTNQDQKGIMPNSHFGKNNILFNGTYDILDNLKVTASANYINSTGKGRNSTGYSDNIISSFRQWMQTNVDYKMQETVYDLSGRNITWNPNSPFDLAPAYWDNPYWVRYENYETDSRNRLIGFVQADWKITDHLSVMGRYSVDTYTELQEERKAVGSGSGEFGVGRPDVTSGYSRFDRTFTETNIDVMLRYYNQLTDDLNLNAMVGTNIRRSSVDQIFQSTNGGLIVPGLYTLSNSVSARENPEELYTKIGVNGIYASASLGFKNYLFLDATIRRDQSSTLPADNNSYWYPSVSGSWLFSTNLDADWLQLGKVRLGWAKVGNDAPWGAIKDTYTQNTTFSGVPTFSLPITKNNSDLLPELSNSLEAGIEIITLQKRLGFDVSIYKTNTINQIMPVAISYATGYGYKYFNAGEVQNKGVELMVFGTPIQKANFSWEITVNWAANRNEVISLKDSIQNLQLAGLQGGVTINARVGEPYGTIQGTDYVYDDNGNKVIGSNGYYLKSSTSDKVLGNVNPDWNLGINNAFTYKNWTASFLIDWQKGGSIFSLDLYYGLGTGLYEETVYINDLGNPVRNPIDEGGGLILDGVLEDGTVNDIRVAGDDYRVFGWSKNPNMAFVYDASYIKLREVAITYRIPDKVMNRVNWLQGASFSLVGSNLWIIHKNLPHADPEASQSSGNIQGWQSGVMPTTRNVGFTVNLQF